MGFFLYPVGANCVRPFGFTVNLIRQPMIFYTENKHRNYGLTIIRRANTVRPYRM